MYQKLDNERDGKWMDNFLFNFCNEWTNSIISDNDPICFVNNTESTQ